MAKYLLLNPLTPQAFDMPTWETLEEALAEFGCKALMSTGVEGDTVAFAYATTKATLEQMCTVVDLEGTMVEYTATYDQLIRI
jgi:hypothetical protein